MNAPLDEPVIDLRGQLWSDEPATIDLLAAKAIALTVVDALLDDSLDPLALGLSGPWGSGKTTVLKLIKGELTPEGSEVPNAKADQSPQVLVVRTDPWRYDPAVGAKESLIGEVLEALAAELQEQPQTPSSTALKAVKKLAKRVDWAKAIKLATKTTLALQIPSFDDMADLVREAPEEEGKDGAPRGLAGFREEFDAIMASDELSHIKRVVVLVDDLDRCLVDTVVETLEAIRLFLSVKGMAFVIAADEDRVAEAIRTRLPEWTMPSERPGGPDALPPEPPSKLYLHKIVQTTVPLPALGAFDTESYLLLLQLQNRVESPLSSDELDAIIEACTQLRAIGALDELQAPNGVDIQTELAFAHRLTAILYEKLLGNPRRIKRFLNDLNIRRSIALRRGIKLDLDVVAKLMVLEVLLPAQFQEVLAWLRTGELRDHLEALEQWANTSKVDDTDAQEADPAVESPDDDAPGSDQAAAVTEAGTELEAQGEPEPSSPDQSAAITTHFDDDLLRWAKLTPELHELDLSPYLHLAASFSGDLLVSQELPQRLRDIAASLLTTRTLDRHSLSDDRLKALPPEDVETLVRHLALRARDRSQEQRGGVIGIGRLASLHPTMVPLALDAYRRLPAADLSVPTAMHLQGLSLPGIQEVIVELAARTPSGPAKQALLAKGGGTSGH